MKAFYDVWYRFGTPPWVGGARPELVELVESGVLTAGRALDLGCGTGDNAVFLARHGFDVTGVDFAPAAIDAARVKARDAGVDVEFVVDDLTRLTAVRGRFDLLVDYGTFDDLSVRQRAAYVRKVVPHSVPGGHFLVWCFEWEPRVWERLAVAVLPFGGLALRPGEVLHWFGDTFSIERITGESGLPSWPSAWAAYLMTRRGEPALGR